MDRSDDSDVISADDGEEENRYEFDEMEGVLGIDMTKKTRNEFKAQLNRLDTNRVRITDKNDRATVEQVLDPRTRMILLKFLNRNVIEEINGCISTGKEANVYHAVNKHGEDKAIKIYKTSILTFSDRDKYVSGEFRFRNGYCRHNPRKMVRTWAEKEMRNLLRIHQAGIRCPKPEILRSHVLLMEFVGTQSVAAPLLKDAVFSDSKARELYLDCVLMMRFIFTKAKLVHADFSEFNLLYHKGSLVVIDVSQSVEHDHPRALDFLRKDCSNANAFFRRFNVPTLTVKELFDFITDPNINDENIDDYLSRLQDVASDRSIADLTEQDKIDEEVFKKSYIPRRLDEVVDYERDIKEAKTQGSEMIYSTLTALKNDMSGARNKPALLESDNELSNSETDAESDSNSEENEDKKIHTAARPRDESPNSRKIRKQAVKEAQKAKRKEKLPKHVKKRKERLGKANSKK